MNPENKRNPLLTSFLAVLGYALCASSFMGVRAAVIEFGVYRPQFAAVDVNVIDASMEGLRTGSKR